MGAGRSRITPGINSVMRPSINDNEGALEMWRKPRLRQLGCHAATVRDSKHQAGDTTEKHADSRERADRPLRAPWPGSPNQDCKNYANDCVKQDPTGPWPCRHHV